MMQNTYEMINSRFSKSTVGQYWKKMLVEREREEMEQKLNPFQTIETLSPIEMLKTCIGLIVAPIRFLLMLVVLIIGTIFLCLTVVGCDISKPLGPKRAKMQRFVITATGMGMCICFGIYHVKIKGKRASTKDCKMLVVAPHSTVMDACVLAVALRGASSVGKIETLKSIVGPFLKASQTLFVNREDKSNRETVAKQISERIDPNGPWERQLALFPEGTCGNRSSLIKFRLGAFNPGSRIQPVVLHWSYTNFDPSWTAGAKSRTLIVLRTFSQLFHSVTVEFLPIYDPSDEEKKSPQLFAQNVRKQMANALGKPTSDHSYEDMFLAKCASKSNLKPCHALPFTFQSLKHQYPDIPELYKTTESLLKIFASAPKIKRQEAKISKEQYQAIAEKVGQKFNLKNPISFQQFSTNNETISFQSFLTTVLNTLSKKSQ